MVEAGSVNNVKNTTTLYSYDYIMAEDEVHYLSKRAKQTDHQWPVKPTDDIPRRSRNELSRTTTVTVTYVPYDGGMSLGTTWSSSCMSSVG